MRANEYGARLESTILHSLTHTSKGYYAFVGLLFAITAWGLFAYTTQLRQGLIVTGMRDVVMWGLYITNFVFFIGISHAGTLISAILRVTNAKWRTPVTRMAEVITAVALMVGALMPMIDLGRPDRVYNLIINGRFQSVIVWDILSISTYLTGSLIYLYIPLIPDIALIRDRLGDSASKLKRWFYYTLSVGWRDTPAQRRRLNKCLGIMAVLIIPIAISVHTVVSWMFSMTLRPGWNSTIFGPYFVIGAIFSGIASILIVMALFRRFYHLEEYITLKHFKYLAYLLLVLNLLYIYFALAEYLTTGYKLQIEDKTLLQLLLAGSQAPLFWAFVFGGLILPALLIVWPRTRTIPGIVFASVLVNIGMWIKRFVIIVPTLQVPLMPFEMGAYSPTWVEWSITAGAFSGFILLFAIFAKVFPVISIWEVKEEAEAEAEAAAATAPQLAPEPGRSALYPQTGGEHHA